MGVPDIGRQLVCVKTMLDDESFVQSLAVWQDRTIVGSSDASICMLDILEEHVTKRMLTSKGNGAYELLVHKDRLISASDISTTLFLDALHQGTVLLRYGISY